jgi:hypothetical protein
MPMKMDRMRDWERGADDKVHPLVGLRKEIYVVFVLERNVSFLDLEK